MPRIYLPNPDIKNNQISVTDEKARYLKSVLRCKPGDEFIIFDGSGNCRKTKIITTGRKEVIAEILQTFPCDVESPVSIKLAQGILKGEKMDLVIQKTTELGVKEILPIIAERSQIKSTNKVNRWRKIAEEASRQSGRSVVPFVHDPVEFNKILSVNNKMGGVIFYENEGIRLSEAVTSLVPSPFVFVGPEGGFTKEEIVLAQKNGLSVVSLGKRILRAETAAISAVTLVQFLLGDMG